MVPVFTRERAAAAAVKKERRRVGVHNDEYYIVMYSVYTRDANACSELLRFSFVNDPFRHCSPCAYCIRELLSARYKDDNDEITVTVAANKSTDNDTLFHL